MTHNFPCFEDPQVILRTFINNLPEINKDLVPMILGYMSNSVTIEMVTDDLENLSFVWYGENFHCFCCNIDERATLYLTKSGGYSFGCGYKNEIDLIQTRENQTEIQKNKSFKYFHHTTKELAYSFQLEDGVNDWIDNKVDSLERIYSNPDHTLLYAEYPKPEKITDNAFYVSHSLVNYWESSIYSYIANFKNFQNELKCLQSFTQKLWSNHYNDDE